MNKQSSFKVVTKGLKDVLRAITNKPIKTDIPEQMQPQEKEKPETQTEDVPLMRINDENTLAIESKDLEELRAYIQYHEIQDDLHLPCFFNNMPCYLTASAFPRVLPAEERSTEIISLVIHNQGVVYAMADYDSKNGDVFECFTEDLQKLQPVIPSIDNQDVFSEVPNNNPWLNEPPDVHERPLFVPDGNAFDNP